MFNTLICVDSDKRLDHMSSPLQIRAHAVSVWASWVAWASLLSGVGFFVADIFVPGSLYSWRLFAFIAALAVAVLAACVWLVTWLIARRKPQENLIEREEVRLQALRFAIALYKAKYGRFPAILRDLCDNNYSDPDWGGPFITWSGEDTFRDTFGYRYEYEVQNGRFRVESLGLERAKRRAAELVPPSSSDPTASRNDSGATERPQSRSGRLDPPCAIPLTRLCLLSQLLQHIWQIKTHLFSPQPHRRNIPTM